VELNAKNYNLPTLEELAVYATLTGTAIRKHVTSRCLDRGHCRGHSDISTRFKPKQAVHNLVKKTEGAVTLLRKNHNIIFKEHTLSWENTRVRLNFT